MRFLFKCLASFFLFTGEAGFAQDVTLPTLSAEAPYESPSCNLKDHHEFDFMHGTWDLKVMIDGRWVPGGYSVHRSALGGCVSFDQVSFQNLGEFYRSLSGRNGYAGIILSSYDKKARNWRQVWHDDMGTVISNIRGRKFEDGMRFVGHAPTELGSELQRFEWKITGENLRLFTIDMSTDGGGEWTRIATIQMVRRN